MKLFSFFIVAYRLVLKFVIASHAMTTTILVNKMKYTIIKHCNRFHQKLICHVFKQRIQLFFLKPLGFVVHAKHLYLYFLATV